MCYCWLGATPSTKTIIVRPIWPVKEHSSEMGMNFFLHVRLECKLAISASSFKPDSVASSRVLWILATPNTTSFVFSFEEDVSGIKRDVRQILDQNSGSYVFVFISYRISTTKRQQQNYKSKVYTLIFLICLFELILQ